MSNSNPSFFQRRPLFSAVLVGVVVLIFLGGFGGLGTIVGPVLAGFLYTSNMRLDETKSIYLSGAKAGVLVSLVPAVPVLIFIILYFALSGDSAPTILLWVTPLLIVWVILNAGFGSFGAWLKSRQSEKSSG
jgi:hypothetical protein